MHQVPGGLARGRGELWRRSAPRSWPWCFKRREEALRSPPLLRLEECRRGAYTDSRQIGGGLLQGPFFPPPWELPPGSWPLWAEHTWVLLDNLRVHLGQ